MAQQQIDIAEEKTSELEDKQQKSSKMKYRQKKRTEINKKSISECECAVGQI